MFRTLLTLQTERNFRLSIPTTSKVSSPLTSLREVGGMQRIEIHCISTESAHKHRKPELVLIRLGNDKLVGTHICGDTERSSVQCS